MTNIKDEISGKIVIVTDGYVQYGKVKIELSEIIDFNYSHTYYNGCGGLSLELFTKKNCIRFHADSSPMKRMFKNKSTENNLKKLESLMNTILPIASMNFVNHNLSKIIAGECVEIWQLDFTKNQIKFTTRFWKKNIILNYHSTNIYFKNHRLGIIGGKGSANYLYLEDERARIKHRYSRNPEHQASPSDYQKILLLLNAMRNINKAPDNNKYQFETLI